jgi:hypothetical protein
VFYLDDATSRYEPVLGTIHLQSIDWHRMGSESFPLSQRIMVHDLNSAIFKSNKYIFICIDNVELVWSAVNYCEIVLRVPT